MYRLKIFVKTSIKKLKRISVFKGKSLIFFIKCLEKENNKHFSIIVKKFKIFVRELNKQISNSENLNKLLNAIYIHTILYSPSKKLRRSNFRAKGKLDIIEKRNSFITIVLDKKIDTNNGNVLFLNKNHKLRSL